MNIAHLTNAEGDDSEMAGQSVSISLDTLTHDPFANTRDGRFYFDSSSHNAALAQLKATLDDGNLGWACLSGAPGLGKTLLRTVLHRSLDPQRFVAVSIETSLLNFDELLLEIISQIRGERAHSPEFPDRYSRLSEFKLLLTEHVVQSGRHLVLLLDEAQGLAKDTLENLRNLSNICAEQANLMSIILIGGSRLESSLRTLPELGQRIAVRVSLAPLDINQTGDYVQHRLDIAGCRQPIPFGTTDLQSLHQVSRGIPREINAILKQAIGFAKLSAQGLSADNLRESLNTRSAMASGQTTEFQSLGMS